MSLSRFFLVSTTAAWVAVASASSAQAQSGASGAFQRELDSLKRQIQSLEKRLETVTKEAEQSKSDAAKASADAAAAKQAAQEKPKADGDGWQITAKDGRPRFVSPDGNFSLAITSRIHFDVADYFQPHHSGPTDTRQFSDLNSGYNLRRGRIGVLGNFMKDWDYNLTIDIGGSNDNTAVINQANITYKGFGPLRLVVGYVDLNYDFANGMSSNYLPLIEAPSASNIVGNVAGGTRASFGGYVVGDRYFGQLLWVGSGPGTSVTDEQASILGRVAYRPIQDAENVLHIGANGSYIFQPNQTNTGAFKSTVVEFNDRPELRVANVSLIDTNNGAQSINARSAYTAGLELAGSHQNFWADSGYYWYGAKQSRAPGAAAPNLNFTGYYVEGGWVVTGERREYDKEAASWGAIHPARPFSLTSGGFGAVELVGRYGVVDLNDHVLPGVSSSTTGGIYGGKQSVAVVGVNWYPIYNVKFMLDYFFTTVNKLDPTGTKSIGQSFQAIALRSQLFF